VSVPGTILFRIEDGQLKFWPLWLDDDHTNPDAILEGEVEGTFAIPYERLRRHGTYRLPLTDKPISGTMDRKGNGMQLTAKQVMAVSLLSQSVGELVGALEGLAMAEENKDKRQRIHETASQFLELDPITGLLDALWWEDDDGDLSE